MDGRDELGGHGLAGEVEAAGGAVRTWAPGRAHASQDPALEPRRVTDARTLRALSHPVRIAVLEVLTVEGATTATELGERIGESPTTCSFHLRQLAKYGFVEEAGGGKGRARPWRTTTVGLSLAGTHDDPETEVAAGALARLVRERQLARYRTWQETSTSYPRRWREAATDSEYVFYLTAEELEQLTEDIRALLGSRFADRLTDPSRRPPEAVPIEMLFLAYPVPFGTGVPIPQDPGDQP
ncbi:MAG TPA: helix-turn-helix domain-containing protein [Streptosporangiaceae bacterium]|nr:helix-turn-helix domain-containing protein [Streptosporangiaceae bacterium]